MATKLLITAAHCFCFNSRSTAIALVTAPFDIALAPAFIDFMDFMGGSMVFERAERVREQAQRSYY